MQNSVRTEGKEQGGIYFKTGGKVTVYTVLKSVKNADAKICKKEAAARAEALGEIYTYGTKVDYSP